MLSGLQMQNRYRFGGHLKVYKEQICPKQRYWIDLKNFSHERKKIYVGCQGQH